MIGVIISAVLGLISLISAVTYFPRPTIEPGVVLDPCDPLSVIFRISNDGLFSVYELTYKFAMLHLGSV
jgi:hypothetical protein